jgi:hypothetical protein
MYHETWRTERDILYDPHTHGLNITKIEAKYKSYQGTLASRSEFSYLSIDMLGGKVAYVYMRTPAARGTPASTASSIRGSTSRGWCWTIATTRVASSPTTWWTRLIAPCFTFCKIHV